MRLCQLVVIGGDLSKRQCARIGRGESASGVIKYALVDLFIACPVELVHFSRGISNDPQVLIVGALAARLRLVHVGKYLNRSTDNEVRFIRERPQMRWAGPSQLGIR